MERMKIIKLLEIRKTPKEHKETERETKQETKQETRELKVVSTPGLQGPMGAYCLACSHRWTAYRDTPNRAYTWLECPRCHADKGVYSGRFSFADDELIYTCSCGNTLFNIGMDCYLCPICGRRLKIE
jgi:hypothetical protein